LLLRVVECAHLSELEPLRAEWEGLLARSDNGSIFTGWEWVEASWKYGAPGREPLILLARSDDGRLVGVLPLARTSRFRVLHTLEVIGCTQLGYPMGDYGGLVTERGMEAAVWPRMLRQLKRSRWSMMDLRNVKAAPAMDDGRWTMDDKSPKSKVQSPESLVSDDFQVRTQVADVVRCVPLPAAWDEYLASLSSNSRQNIRRKLRKLEQDGLQIEQVKPDDEATRQEAMEVFFKFHQDRWEQDPSGGGFPDNWVRVLHRYLAGSLAEAGKLDLRMVRSLEGEIIGVIYNFRQNGVGYYYHLGASQDERWQQYSLGTCLLADSIQAAINDGCHTFDLLRGDHDYKRHFGGYTTHNMRVVVYRYGWLPKVEDAARQMKRKLKRGTTLQLEAQHNA
jgi:CelD/BcsL family acetyltransferase involved in cellulose biosynthesis